MTRARALSAVAILLVAFVAAVGLALHRSSAPPEPGAAGTGALARSGTGAVREPTGGATSLADGAQPAGGGARVSAEERREPAGEVRAGFVPWSGRVVDGQSGEPVPDVAVRIELDASSWNTTTGADGTFELERPAGEDVRLELDHPLYVAARFAAAGFDERDWPLARAGRIAGQLRGAGADSLEDARVVLWREWRSPDGELWLQETGADAGGHFAFEGLAPGAYALAARAPESAAALRGGLVLAAGAALSADLELARGARLVGRVYERTTRASVEGAELVATWISAGLPREVQDALASETRTDGAGAYELTGLSPAEVRVVVTTPWDSESRRRIEVTAHGERVEQDFAVGRLASVAGRVFDAAGGSLPGAPVVLLDADGLEAFSREEGAEFAGGRTRPAGVLEVTADEGGRFQLEDVPTDQRLGIVAWPPEGRADELPSRLVSLTLRPEEERTGLELTLERGTALAGTVRDSQGQPVEGAEVALERQTPLGSWPGPVAVTDEAGRFAFEGLGAGKLRMEVRAAGFEPRARKLALAPGVPAEVEVALDPAASLVARVLDPDGRAVPEASVVAWQTRPDERRGRRKLKRKERADEWGQARFDALPEGRWTVLAGAPGWELVEPAEVVVPGDQEVELELAPVELPRVEVIGTVRTDRGDGVPRGLRLDGLTRGLVATDGGDFRITGVRPGKRDRLVVRAEGCLERKVPLDLRAGGTVDAGVIDLSSVTEVRVELRRPSGQPIRAARVMVAPDQGPREPGKRGPGGAKGQRRRAQVYGQRIPMGLKEHKPGLYTARLLPGRWTLRASLGKKRHEEKLVVKRRDRQTVRVTWSP